MPRFARSHAAALAFLLPALASLVSTPAAVAAPVRLEPGTYITEQGWGDLRVKRSPSGGLAFEIEAVGANGHSCSLDGEIVDGWATLAAEEEAKPCRVRFAPEGDAIHVTAEDAEVCRFFCGMRAHFEGIYFRPTPGCDPAARETKRAAFKKLYDRKAYAKAAATLQPVLDRCARITDSIEQAWIRNDLALTAYKLGDVAGCLRLLAPLAEDAAKTDEALRENLPPADADSYLPVVKATRTNLKLCRRGK